MKNRKFFLISLFFLLLCVSNSFGQGLPDVAPNHRWPVETGHVMPRNGRVPGTPSEYRTPYTGAANIFGDIVPAGTHRFHQGLDVSAAAPHPDNVYSIEPGTHTIDFESAGYNSRIRLGNRIYWHTTPLAGFMDNVTLINGNDHIGDMSSDHVHLQPTINTINGTQNYLVNLLPGYVDSEAPEIYNNWYYLNGHSKTNNSTVLSQTVTDANGLVRRVVYEKVDLVVQTRDDRVNYDGTGYGGNIGPNKLSYNIKNEDGNISYTGGEVLNVDFTTLAGHTTATNVFGFHANCCTPADFRYVLTSHLHTAPHDRFWNTRLRLGQIENWDVSSGRNPDLDARINLEAHFEDGVKTLEYTVRDLDGGGAATENESTTFDYIVIDNFRPFVQQIRIYQVLPDNPEYLVYSGNWEWIESIGELRFGTNTLGSGDPFNGFRGPAQEDYPLQVEITASEPMLSLQISGLTPHFNVGAPINLVNPVVPTSNNPSRHTFYFEIDLPGLLSNIPANHYGFYMLDIEGEDIAGNDLIGYTRDISTAPDVTTVTPFLTWIFL